MANLRLFSVARSWLGTMGSAIAVTGAFASHHRPSDAQLRGVGIDPKAFDSIGGRQDAQ